MTGLVAAGLVMLVGGAALLAVRRRRDIPDGE
jgi:LPXTG-motif cell wall-anchored protein